MSGIAQFVSKRGAKRFSEWCDAGYHHLKEVDEQLSKEFGVNESIKITSIKPSGTVSLLAGATPGIHFPHSQFYIRRIRLSSASELLKPIEEAGYHIENDEVSGPETKVVEIPVKFDERITPVSEVPIRKQLEMASLL